MNYKVKLKLIIVCAFIAILMFLGLILNKYMGLSMKTFSICNIEDILRRHKETSILIYMLLNLIRPIFLIIPAWIFAVVAGVIYGPFLGTIYALIGIFISATVAFYIARLLGRDFFSCIFGEKFDKMDNKLKNNGFKVLFITRITVVFPFDPLSFIAGISNINYRTYILATMLGVIPETVAFSFLGMGLKSILSLKMLIILLIITFLIFGLFCLRKKIFS